MKKLIIMGAIGVAVASTQAGAQAPAQAPPTQSALPQDMTRQQAQQFSDSMFQRLDTNHDGTLTRQEAEAVVQQMGGRGHMIERTFGTAQSLTLTQFEAAALARFDAEDTNHDGVVSAAERDAARAARQAARQ
jgi:glycine/D-amino acid oxidase-like deaminating enzyme